MPPPPIHPSGGGETNRAQSGYCIISIRIICVFYLSLCKVNVTLFSFGWVIASNTTEDAYGEAYILIPVCVECSSIIVYDLYSIYCNVKISVKNILSLIYVYIYISSVYRNPYVACCKCGGCLWLRKNCTSLGHLIIVSTDFTSIWFIKY